MFHLHLGLRLRTRKETLRPKAVRIRWSDKARVPQEGQDHQEGRAKTGVHTMQDQGTAVAQALQALRARVCWGSVRGQWCFTNSSLQW